MRLPEQSPIFNRLAADPSEFEKISKPKNPLEAIVYGGQKGIKKRIVTYDRAEKYLETVEDRARRSATKDQESNREVEIVKFVEISLHELLQKATKDKIRARRRLPKRLQEKT